MGDMRGGGGVKNLKKGRDVLCERPPTLIKIKVKTSDLFNYLSHEKINK